MARLQAGVRAGTEPCTKSLHSQEIQTTERELIESGFLLHTSSIERPVTLALRPDPGRIVDNGSRALQTSNISFLPVRANTVRAPQKLWFEKDGMQ